MAKLLDVAEDVGQATEPAPEPVEPQEPATEPEPAPEPEPQPASEPQPDALAEKDKELATLREQLYRMEGRLEGMQQERKREPEPEPFAFLRDKTYQTELNELLENDPARALAYQSERMAREFQSQMQRERERNEQNYRSVNPDFVAAQAAYDELSQHDWFRSLDREAQQGAAIAYIKMKAKANSESNGAQPRPPAVTPRSPRKVVKPKEAPRLSELYPDVFERMGGLKRKEPSYKMDGR